MPPSINRPDMRSAPAPEQGATGPDRNVLLIVLDDIGVEWFSFYGIGDRYSTDIDFSYCYTPTLVSLVNTGVLFTEAYANPLCGPTRANIQTGLYAYRTGFGENIRDPGTSTVVGNRLSDSYAWLPRVIHQARPGVYDTAAIGKWHMCDGYSYVVPGGTLPPPDNHLDHALAVGYDYSAIHIPNYGGTYTWYRIVNGVLDPPGGISSPPFDETTWAPTVHLADSSAWIASRTRPWFLYLAFNAPHAAFTVPPFSTLSAATVAELVAAGLAEGTTLPLTSTYAAIKLVWRASMESVDHCIGAVLAGMTPAVRDNTVVLVTSDNGTVINALPPGFLHSKREVYRGGTQIPLIAWGPAVASPGRLSSDIVHTVDLYATVLDIVQCEASTDTRDYDSVSFYPVLQGATAKRTRLFTEVFGAWGQTDLSLQTAVQRAIFDGRWRYVVRGGVAELYDDHADFLEVNNLIASLPPDLAGLPEKLRRELDETLGR